MLWGPQSVQNLGRCVNNDRKHRKYYLHCPVELHPCVNNAHIRDWTTPWNVERDSWDTRSWVLGVDIRVYNSGTCRGILYFFGYVIFRFFTYANYLAHIYNAYGECMGGGGGGGLQAYALFG